MDEQTIYDAMYTAPRMLHSGFGLYEYPESHLSAIAYSGRKAILIFAEDVDKTYLKCIPSKECSSAS